MQFTYERVGFLPQYIRCSIFENEIFITSGAGICDEEALKEAMKHYNKIKYNFLTKNNNNDMKNDNMAQMSKEELAKYLEAKAKAQRNIASLSTVEIMDYLLTQGIVTKAVSDTDIVHRAKEMYVYDLSTKEVKDILSYLDRKVEDLSLETIDTEIERVIEENKTDRNFTDLSIEKQQEIEKRQYLPKYKQGLKVDKYGRCYKQGGGKIMFNFRDLHGSFHR